MKSKIGENTSSRPYSMTVERRMKANAAALYEAWTKRFDRWFAEPGQLIMTPEVDKPFFFYNRKDWGSHAHYGRFIRLEKDCLIEMTWVTPKPGTEGTETLIRVELIPEGEGTLLRLTHSGFADEKSCKGHEENWPEGLEVLDEALAGKAVAGATK